MGTTDKAGRDQAHFDYGAFGEEQFARADDLTPFRYTGRWGGYTDDRLGMVINWNRGYDPRTGRWGSRDPIGVMGGANIYAYVLNRPTLFTDEWGLCSHTPEECEINRAEQIFKALSPIPLDFLAQATVVGEESSKKAAEYAAEMARLRALTLKYPKMSSYVRQFERYAALLREIGNIFKGADLVVVHNYAAD